MSSERCGRKQPDDARHRRRCQKVQQQPVEEVDPKGLGEKQVFQKIVPEIVTLVRIGYVNTMVPLVVIPEFVFGEMRKTTLGVAGMLAIYAVEYITYLLLLF